MCTIATLVACLSLYAESGVSIQDAEPARFEVVETRHLNARTGVYESGATTFATTSSRNPYGTLTLGAEIELTPRLSFRLELEHVSSLATGKDRGVNAARLAGRWYLRRAR